MSTIEKCLAALSDDERETYVSYLREVVGAPGVGGYGQYLGSLVPLVFATDEQKLEAMLRMSAEARRQRAEENFRAEYDFNEEGDK